MTFFGYLNTGLFPVVYKIGDLNFFATKAAAESDSDCSKCELFYLHKDKKLFVSNKPKKLPSTRRSRRLASASMIHWRLLLCHRTSK